jgi:murein DD-endopeptidase MepM/ murein hydrolase activator NlpD/peptidoglycan hydrolase-like protein with peptidoglycan-binding domain
MRTQQPSYEDRDSEIDSPFAQERLFVDVASEQWELRADELSSRSPFVTTLELEAAYQAEPDELEEELPFATELSEEFDALAGAAQDEELDAEADTSGPSALSSQERAWVLALDRSALERLPDAAQRRRYLEEVNWRDIEFPGNVPKGGRDRQILNAHWKLSEELFNALAGVTPERRVPSMIRYHDPVVVKVPGKPSERLFPESCDVFVRMREAAKADGVRLEIGSSWRSAVKQAAISKSQPNPKAAARGQSAHMYGLAVDLRLSVPGLNVAEASTRTAEKMANLVRMYRSPVYKWMALRAKDFGWYPYRREPWHWEYNPPGFKERFEGSASSGGSPSPSTSTTSAPPTTSTPTTELVKFAQHVLNAVAGEKLADDGDLGPRTRAALERFRKQHNLGSGGALDMPTELALAQRALEELAQQPMFAQPGVRDAKTDQALAAFKAARGLGLGSTLDAPVRRALADALARMPSRSRAAASTSSAGSASSPTDHLGGLLWEFKPRSSSIQIAIFCAKAARGKQEVELLLYAHGLLDRCPGPARVRGLITERPFKLASTVDAANRPIVLAVPYLEWSKQGKFHPLGKPALLNNIVDEVLADLGRVQGSTVPALRDLVVAGHSRAYGVLEPLAAAHASPEMQQGALARLSQVWAFDTAYIGDVEHWKQWLKAKPGLEVSVFYRPKSKTDKVGYEFYRQRGGRLKVIQANESHCEVPTIRLPILLGGSAASTDEELVSEEILDEEFEPPEPLYELEEFDPGDEREEEDELLLDEQEREEDLTSDELAYEQLAPEDVVQEELDYEGPYSDEEEPKVDGVESDALVTEFAVDDELALDTEAAFEFDDEVFADAQLEEQASNRSPLPVPPDRPIPFAPLPPMGAYWPVRSVRKDARVVSYMYQAPSGVVGKPGRMFLAGRTGKLDGKQKLRWHVGIDLFASINDVVVACEPGKIVDFGYFYPAKSGERTYRILIEHNHSGIVANYGEVTEDSLRRHGLKVGMTVAAGEPIGFVSTTSMLHFETYVKGTTTTHRWWKDEPDAPRELLNPTRYLLFLREHGLPLPQGSRTSAPAAKPATAASGTSSTGKPPGELVRFAQRVLNATEGARLADDGDLGPLTRAALVKFCERYNLGAGGALDEATTLALAQRALEELAQQSMFAQPGLLDARTREALSAFKSQRGLGMDAGLDAATRVAIADALARRRSSAITSGHSPPPRSGSTSTSIALPNLGAALTPPTNPSAYRKFRLTTYYAADQREYPTGAVMVSIRDSQGNQIATGSPAFFANLSLEGSGILTDGKVIKVAGKMVPVSHGDYAPVLAYHLKAYEKSNRKRAENRQNPIPTTYSGIVVKSGRIVEALAFQEVRERGVGYGTEKNGIPAVPFRTLAADLGLKPRSAAAWKGKGGLVPVGTHVYIREYDGLQLPDGTVHDGWFIVNDTGGAIFGVHFDVFTGTRALRQKAKLPEFGQVWFAGIEQRIKPDDTYGLSR